MYKAPIRCVKDRNNSNSIIHFFESTYLNKQIKIKVQFIANNFLYGNIPNLRYKCIYKYNSIYDFQKCLFKIFSIN